MMHEVVYSQQANHQLRVLFDWLADVGTPDRADEFIASILAFCESLADFPLIGTARDEIFPGLRTLGYRRRVTIAFVVTERTVEILGVHYAGRDFETLMREESD